MCNFWPKKWSRSLKSFDWWSLTRELLKQYLTEKQNGCLRSGRLREVVAYEKWCYERVDCRIVISPILILLEINSVTSTCKYIETMLNWLKT